MSDLQWRKELGAVIGLGAAVAIFFWPAATLQAVTRLVPPISMPSSLILRSRQSSACAAAMEAPGSWIASIMK